MLTSYLLKTFPVTLKVIPSRSWSSTALDKVNFLSFPSTFDHLDINLEIVSSLKGIFKIAHSGSITSNATLPPFSLAKFISNNFISLMQMVHSGVTVDLKKTHIYSEMICLDWPGFCLTSSTSSSKATVERMGIFWSC